jgi:virginiamycin B lyase
MKSSRTGSVLAGTLMASGVAFAQDQQWPDGKGKDVVSTVCVSCHEARRFTAGGGYTPEGWQTVVDMMKNIGAPIPADRIDDVRQYLTVNWPEKPKPKAVVIPGDVKVEFHSWPVPTPGSRPHDPLATRDGMIWWSGQSANKLGRVNPKTGEMKEYPLESPLAGPHGLIEDKSGNIWYAGNWGAHVGMLDPKTGRVVEYRSRPTWSRAWTWPPMK